MEQIWRSVLSDLESSLPTQTFQTWIRPIRPLRLDGDELLVEVPSKFFADWLQDHDYLSLIERSATGHAGRPVQVRCVPSKQEKAYVRPSKKESPAPPGWQERARRIGLNPKYTFEAFVVGSSNQFAHAASLAVAERSTRTYNPLFIYGGVGLGKTHLLNAIGNFRLANDPNAKVCYVHSESFVNEMIQALAHNRMPEFREKYRKMDILLMDDIQFIAGKERTQEEFFHTFNTLYENHRNIVVTSDKFPKEIPGLADRLRSRFEWGLIADIQPPDVETKVAILQKKAELESIFLPLDVAHFLASHCPSNIRELEGSLITIMAFASLTKAELTVDLAKSVLRGMIRENSQKVTVDRIVKAVAQHYHLTAADLRGKRRTKAVALPRQIAMYLARELTDCSFPEIGQKIGGRDHSTVMYACEKISKALEADADLRAEVESIRRKISG
ncbi:MAG: chromosomal replication initiator protein DnaA [Deltaproteobacteria bacterium]|nr:chromosomal replication initiator protein DnaA [Deltaproteobacteria bacterium]